MSLKNNTILLNNLLDIANSLPEATADTSDATATANDILSGKTAYVKEQKIVGTINTKTVNDLTISGATVTTPSGYYATNVSKSVAAATQATPSVSINTNGLITATATQSAGYVSAGSKSGTLQLTTQAAKTITPSTSNQTAVANGVYTTGAITVKGDSNLIADNIKKGVSIFGVAGNHEGGSGVVEVFHMTSTSDKINFSSNNGTLEVWGTATDVDNVALVKYNRTFSFHGTKYTKTDFNVTGGSQNTTSMSLSISADGTLNGLPSDLTSIDVLVMRRI